MRISGDGLTFDDVLLLPDYSEVLPREVNLATRLTREISLQVPLIAAAMDTVTEARLAIALAQKAASASFTRTCRPKSRRRRFIRSRNLKAA